jgi:hypothetical protein
MPCSATKAKIKPTAKIEAGKFSLSSDTRVQINIIHRQTNLPHGNEMNFRIMELAVNAMVIIW